MLPLSIFISQNSQLYGHMALKFQLCGHVTLIYLYCTKFSTLWSHDLKVSKLHKGQTEQSAPHICLFMITQALPLTAKSEC